jgi:hypothetical protein
MSTYSDHDIAECHTNQNKWKVVEVLCQTHLLYTGFYYLIKNVLPLAYYENG